MLVFRDWLRMHEDERRRYENAKRELASHTWKHVQNYADAKSGVIREILGRAGAAGAELVIDGGILAGSAAAPAVSE